MDRRRTLPLETNSELSIGGGIKLRCSYWLVDEGNSCDCTKDQLEADISAARLTPAGVHVSAPLQETEGGGG